MEGGPARLPAHSPVWEDPHSSAPTPKPHSGVPVNWRQSHCPGSSSYQISHGWLKKTPLLPFGSLPKSTPEPQDGRVPDPSPPSTAGHAQNSRLQPSWVSLGLAGLCRGARPEQPAVCGQRAAHPEHPPRWQLQTGASQFPCGQAAGGPLASPAPCPPGCLLLAGTSQPAGLAPAV